MIYTVLADRMNDFLISVSDKLPRLNKDNTIFTVNDELPDQYVIPVMNTFEALCNVKVRKATGPDTIPAWLLKNNAEVLAPPLTAIFNSPYARIRHDRGCLVVVPILGSGMSLVVLFC